MALRADTARHFIVGATVVIFSAAALATAMRYQDTSPVTDLTLTAELPAREASAAARIVASEPISYRDGSRGAGADVATTLDATAATATSAGAWTNRDRGAAANGGGAAWWGSTSARLTPTSSRRGGGGSLSMPGSGYAVSGGARAPKEGASVAPPRGRSSSNGGSGGGGSAAPVFDDHTTPVGDLVQDPVPVDIGEPGGNPRDPAGPLSHSPEPASLLLMATGVIGVLGAARRRRR